MLTLASHGASALAQQPRTQSAENAAEGADIRFLLGPARFSQYESEGRDSPTGQALGLRLGIPRDRPFQFALDVRLQAAGLAGPCTREDAQNGECEYVERAQSLGEVGLSLGAAYKIAPGLRIGAMASPGLTTRGWDRVEGTGNANRYARPISASATLDYRWREGVGIWLEYRHMRKATFLPDSQAVTTVNAGPMRSAGHTVTAALTLPLRQRQSQPIGISNPAFTMFGFVVENDLPWRDESYTNGIRAVLAEVPGTRRLLRYGHLGAFALAPTCPYRGTVTADSKVCRTTLVSVTQSIHTPTRIYDPLPRNEDRPHAGTLFFSGRTELLRAPTDDEKFWSLSSEFQFGVLGQSAGAAETQRMAHWLIATRAARPAGWTRQLQDRGHFVWLADGSKRLWNTRASIADVDDQLSADLTVRGNTVIGTTHGGAGIGLVGRWSPFGTELPLSLQRVIIPTVRLSSAGNDSTTISTPTPPRVAVVATADARHVFRNETLSERNIDTQWGIVDLGVGLQAEVGPFALTGLVSRRSREFAPAGVPIKGFARYWSLQLMYRPPGA